jgi:hypothetical protein
LTTKGAAGAKADHSCGVRIEDTPPLLVSWTEVWGDYSPLFYPDRADELRDVF